MVEFKTGDKVKRISREKYNYGVSIGEIVTIKRLYDINYKSSSYIGPLYEYILESGQENHAFACELKLITNEKSMNLKEKFITAFLSEPEKSFRKAGITNGDGILTDEGQEVFLTWLLKQQGGTFKTEVVDPLLAEEEKCAK